MGGAGVSVRLTGLFCGYMQFHGIQSGRLESPGGCPPDPRDSSTRVQENGSVCEMRSTLFTNNLWKMEPRSQCWNRSQLDTHCGVMGALRTSIVDGGDQKVELSEGSTHKPSVRVAYAVKQCCECPLSLSCLLSYAPLNLVIISSEYHGR